MVSCFTLLIRMSNPAIDRSTGARKIFALDATNPQYWVKPRRYGHFWLRTDRLVPEKSDGNKLIGVPISGVHMPGHFASRRTRGALTPILQDRWPGPRFRNELSCRINSMQNAHIICVNPQPECEPQNVPAAISVSGESPIVSVYPTGGLSICPSPTLGYRALLIPHPPFGRRSLDPGFCHISL